MKALAETHIVLWWLSDDPRLAARHRELLSDPQNFIYWSAASSFEVAIKLSVGKLALPESPSEFFRNVLTQDGFE